MKSPLALASLGALGFLLLHGVSANDKARVNGWYPCAYSLDHGPQNATALHDVAKFECAELEVPLCYDGVCKSDRKISVFVKRRLGTTASSDANVPRKAALLMQGGPGSSSVGMEDIILDGLMDPDDDSVDFYTFDHRGTGRSEFLTCDAASALTPGGPSGTAPSADELPSCIDDMNFQYDGQAAAFSTTSVAMDVRLLIDTFLSNHHVFPYGMSYGTYLTQRLLQLNVPQVKGYIFDGVDVLSTKNDPIEGANSHWNQAMKGPSRRLLEFCFDDPECPLKLKSRETALEEVLELLNKLDKEPNACVQFLADTMKVEKPAEALRMYLFGSVTNPMKRAQVLDSLSTVDHCTDDDIAALSKPAGGAASQAGEAAAAAAPPAVPPLDLLTVNSQLLFDVIVFSERWAQPPPTREERLKFAYEAAVNAPDVERNALSYCLYTGSTEPACEELKDKLPAKGNATFFYPRDKYFETPLTLPAHASALVINGGLDFQTPSEFGELLFSKLKGSGTGAMMVNFDFGTHCQGEAVAPSMQQPCRNAIVRQFIKSDGDVTAVDTSCMETLPTAIFHNEEAAAAEGVEQTAGDAEQSGGEDVPEGESEEAPSA